jgi:opacity protein-like surface antigen
MLRTRLCSHAAAVRQSGGSVRWPLLMPVGAVALMAPSVANAQCFGQFNAITSLTSTVNTAFLPSGSAFVSSSPNGAPNQQGGGVWSRAVGGSVNTETNSNFTASFNIPGFGSVPLSASCRPTVKQDFEGFEAGHDIAVLNSNNSDWHVGVMAGYVGAKVNFPGLSVDVPAQTGSFEAPSAGFYSAFYKGNFSADVQARLYSLQADSLGQRLDGRGYSFAGNMGYRFDLPGSWLGNWSVEPSIGGIYSRTSVDPLNIADVGGSLGAGVPGLPIGPNTIVAESGTLEFQDVESFLGRASVKLGTSVPLLGGQVVAYPFLTASVFHEFLGNATATLVSNGTFPAFGTSIPFQGIGTLTTSSVGTYGQFGAGSAFQLSNTGWLGFARVDYRTGENIQGYSVSAGLRYQLDDSGHLAENHAPYPVKAPMKAAPAGGYDWTGLYVGASVGSTWGRTHWNDQGGTTDPDFAGVLGGGQVGFNYQTGRFVWGIEADAGDSNARGAAACPSQPLLLTCEDDVGAMGSVAGRFGYAWGRALFYGKGGWAYGAVKAGTSLNFIDPGVASPPASAAGLAHSTNWESGWTAGVGMEFALTDKWSAKAEYMHYEFPQYAFTVAQNATANASTTGDIVRIGVNYHFWPW